MIAKVIEEHPLFKDVSLQTVYLMAYELITFKAFRDGDLLMSKTKKTIAELNNKKYRRSGGGDVKCHSG